MKSMFEPLVPGAIKVPNTNFYRAVEHRDDLKEFGLWAADQIEQAIEFEGADTVAAVFLEPVQNSGGCFPPPPGYFERVREICDRHDVLLVSDEVICAFGRLGTMFAADKFGYVPDMITCAKGMTSGYSPIGACIVSDKVAEPFWNGTDYFPHGYTFGGHPVSAAVAMANLDIFEREGLNQHVLDNEGAFRRDAREAHRPADRRRRARRRLLLRHRDGQGQGDQGDVRRRRVRAAAARLPVQGAVRRRAVLPGRRPRRPGRPARAAADLRSEPLRRDRADPAVRPHRSVDPAVKIGIPREVKNNEYRVAITPAGVHELARHGHEVVIERDAGVGSSIPDADFVAAGREDPADRRRRLGRPAT